MVASAERFIALTQDLFGAALVQKAKGPHLRFEPEAALFGSGPHQRRHLRLPCLRRLVPVPADRRIPSSPSMPCRISLLDLAQFGPRLDG